MTFRLAFCLFFLLFGCVEVQAQLATLRGRVFDAASGTPLPGVNLLMANEEGHRTGTATDGNGFYTLSRITPGTYVLTASFIGYHPHTDTLTFDFGQQQTLDLQLRIDEAELDEVVIETERSQTQRSQAGLHTVKPSMLSRVPMPDVTYDLAGYLLTLPGFVSPGDRGGQLFVRGGTPTQNLVLIDGMTVYQPFHIIGFYSAFPADIISYVDVYAGGFGARYGGRISSVIDVTTRNGNKERPVGAVSIAPFLSSVRVELPIEPGKVSLLVSARESIIERISPNLLGRSLPFRFGDRFLKFHAFLNKTSSLSATMLRTFDEGNIAAREEENAPRNSSWRNEAYGGRYTYLPQEFPILTQWSAYGSRLRSRYSPTEGQERRSQVVSLNMESLFLYLLGDTQIGFGIFVNTNRFEYDLGPFHRTQQRAATSGGAYVDARFNLGKTLRLEPGFRFETFSKGIHSTLGPRFRLLWLPSGAGSRQQFSLAWGRYFQQIIGLTNEQDVTDVFTVWDASPRGTDVPSATHFILGWQRYLFPWLQLSAEGYYKQLSHLVFPRFGQTLNQLDAFNRVDGDVQGLDLRLEISRAAVYANIGYSLSSVEYKLRNTNLAGLPPIRDSDLSFPPPHDRRHQLNTMAQVAFGPYRLSIRWQYGSGLPFTQVNGYYQLLGVTNAEDQAFHTEPGTTGFSRVALYGGRLPSYHRLDLSAERIFRFKRLTTRLQAGLINVYDRPNIFDYNIFTGERLNQLPLIPSLGLNVEIQ